MGQTPALLPIGPVDLSFLPPEEQEVMTLSHELAATRYSSLDASVCIWHEWDHPPVALSGTISSADHYVAAPIFELDRLRQDAAEPLRKCWRVLGGTKHATAVLRDAHVDCHHLNFMGVDTNTFKPTKRHTNTAFRIVNVGKQEYRKGHDLVYKAAAELISKGMNQFEVWCLWHNPFVPPSVLAQQRDRWLLDAASHAGVSPGELHDRVKMIGQMPSAAGVAELMSSGDVGLYPYRAEGWNLPLLETMACGQPVIAAYNTGPIDYLTDQNARLIGSLGLVQAHDGIWFHGRQGRWVVPNLRHVVTHLTELYERWRQGEPKEVNFAGVTTAKEFSWRSAARKLLDWITTECAASS
jgi:glycosyltransferase involved in cell wall biosynthesis